MKRVVVVGGGAAGLMAGIWAARPASEVVVLERNPTPGRKILISGGGRCNVLPDEFSPGHFVTASSPNILKRILASWPLPDQIRFFEETLGVPLKLETDSGKYFPVSDRARDVVDALVGEARRRGARVRLNTRVDRIEREGEKWRITVEGGETLTAGALILATGGLSVPATGSDGAGLRWVEGLGHTIHPLYPALTPLLTRERRHHDLAGISKIVTIFAPMGDSVSKGVRRTHGFLFTHRGYSGPAVMDLSHYAVIAGDPDVQPLWVQWTDLDSDAWEQVLLQSAPTRAITTVVRNHLPVRLADMLVAQAGACSRTVATLRREERRQLVRLLTRYPLPYSGNEGYLKAEVTGGGVALGEVKPQTLESRICPGLFLCGEMLDAFGPIGGHNFMWAWATGRLAGLGSRVAPS